MSASPEPRPSDVAPDPPVLALRDLVVSVPGPGRDRGRAVDGVDLDLRAGEILALVGESGAGKSLTAAAVLGLTPRGCRVEAGWLSLGETVLDLRHPRGLRPWRGRYLSAVPQDPVAGLDPVMTVGGQLQEGFRAIAGLDRETARRSALDLLSDVGLPEPDRVFGSYPQALSGGMARRAAVALGLTANPRVLIADEPTASLDGPNGGRLLDLLRGLCRSRAMALLLISHDLRTVTARADRFAVMRAGRIVETGLAADLLAAPTHPYTQALARAVPHPDRAPPGAWRSTASTGPSAKTEAAPVLRLKAVCRRFPAAGQGVRAARDVSLSLEAGEVLGLVGESGAGKSTLARLAAGLDRPDSGRVEVLGADPRGAGAAPARRTRRHLGVVFQDPMGSLDPLWPVARSVAEPLRHARPRLPVESERERVVAAFEAAGLDPRLGERRPRALSGGQCQRVSVARALVGEPRLLICDEPTASLDVSAQAELIAVIRARVNETGLACLFISHDLGVIRQIADRITVMHQGELVESGPTQVLLDAPRHPATKALVAAARGLPIP